MGGYYVSDVFRTNPKSLIPGGSTVVVENYDGTIKAYDKVKNTTAYINAIIKDLKIKSISVNGELAWKRDKNI